MHDGSKTVICCYSCMNVLERKVGIVNYLSLLMNNCFFFLFEMFGRRCMMVQRLLFVAIVA